MTKKCRSSFITYILFSAICLVSMHLMLLADVNKYVGVGSGGVILVVAFVLYMVFRKHKNLGCWILLFFLASAIGCGLAISSLYVFLGAALEVIYTFCVWGAYAIIFLVYCLVVNISLFKRHPRICLAIFGLLVLAGGIVGIFFSSKITFSLALMMFIPFISYLATILAHSNNYSEHINTLALVSFIGLFVVVIVVLIVISEGEGLDGLDISPESNWRKNNGKNPYDFI